MDITLKDGLTLGRSGLRVSPLCLGTMTFGKEWGWGTEEPVSRAVFERYVEAGGNFIDTADMYTAGTSETMLGRFIKEDKLRDRLVLATKFTFNQDASNLNSGGNGRKNIHRALEASLRRLQSEYVDLYWLHCWDTITPVEEVVATLDGLVAHGKIRYWGLSDTPAWYAARAATLAQKDGRERPAALQLEYSLIERNIEREHIPAAQELGMGLCPWSPLAGGFLAGKYTREGRGEGRLAGDTNPLFNRFTARNWTILEQLRNVAGHLGRPVAQVALNWVASQPGVTSPIIGATSVAQLNDNLSALGFEIPAELRAHLDEVSAIEAVHPYTFFGPTGQRMIHGQARVETWRPSRLTGAAPSPQEKPATVAAHK